MAVKYGTLQITFISDWILCKLIYYLFFIYVVHLNTTWDTHKHIHARNFLFQYIILKHIRNYQIKSVSHKVLEAN